MPKSPRPFQNFHVRPDQANQTLSAALRVLLQGKSWSEVQRLVTSRYVLVNGNLCTDAGRRLKTGEVVRVLDQPAQPPARDQDVRVVYWDQYVVVIEKPAGITSNRHPDERSWPDRRKQLQPTLDEMLPRIVAKLEAARKSAKKGKTGKRRAI